MAPFSVAQIASLFFGFAAACEANTPLKNARHLNYKIILPVGQANFRTVEQAKFSDFLAGAPISDGLRHVINLEHPALFNQMLASFRMPVEAGRWPPRDPRSERA